MNDSLAVDLEEINQSTEELFEKFSMTTTIISKIPKGKFDNLRGDRKDIKVGFNKYTYGEYKNRSIMLLCDPWVSTKPNLRIFFQLSHWSSLKQLTNYIIETWGEEFLSLLFFKGEISRIDFYIDLPYKARAMAKLINRPRARYLSEYTSRKESFYFGKKSLNGFLLLVYDKDKTFQDGCRVEARYYGKSVPVKNLAQLTNLLDFDPFWFFEINLLNGPLILSQKLTKSQRRKTLQFLKDYKNKGFQYAKKEFSKKGSYTRTLLPILKIGLTKKSLTKKWKRDCCIPFLKDFDINETIKVGNSYSQTNGPVRRRNNARRSVNMNA